jgi:hypothetical protein
LETVGRVAIRWLARPVSPLAGVYPQAFKANE